MIEIAFVLLMYTGDTISEYTHNDSLGECLSTKRQVARHYQSQSGSGVRWACEEYKVKTEELHDRKYIVDLIEKIEYRRNPLMDQFSAGGDDVWR